MGTSSARRGPTGRLWRLAKGAATRYLSPGSAAAVAAREVAARYVAALGEAGKPGPAGALAAFRLTRKVAQNLGAFGCQVDSEGWPAALGAWGLKELAGEPETLAQALSAALEVAGGGLEPAVAHTALVGVLLELREPGPSVPTPGALWLVERFLSNAFHLRLTLDLGESLEAAAPGFVPLRQGLEEIAACIALAVETGRPQTSAPLTPAEWLGLPGWTWVTDTMAALLSRLSSAPGSPDFTSY
ncbi:MAG: hypothetical protein NTY36_05165 [Deltaproteobacteria bacterium]|nr:hypothetical protein [Deltaproteobacteria bacterium]